MTLLEYIKNEYTPEFVEAHFPFKVRSRSVKKGTIIYPYNKVGDKIFFLNQGIVETTVSINDIEKTIGFVFSNHFFYSLASAVTKIPSEIQGTAITDCTYEWFYHQDYLNACDTSLLANKIGRIEIEKYYINKLIREKNFLTKTKEEMYKELVENTPDIIKSVPLNKIANYLGILPETLSRIRRKVIS